MGKAKEQDRYVLESSEITVLDIPLDVIHTEGQSVRLAQDDDHVVELAMSISKHGLLEPIIVRNREDGGYQLLAGFHRLAAYTRLNKKTIPSYIYKNKETPVKAIALIENIIRRDMSLEEEVEAVKVLTEVEELSPSSICDLLGKSREWVMKRLSIPNFPEDVKDELLDGRISLKVAEIISQIKEDSFRKTVLNSTILQKLSARQVDELAHIYIETPSVESAVEEGVKTARQIQSSAPPYKECYLCKRQLRVWDVKFVTVCMDEIDCSEAILSEEKRREGGV